MLALLPRPVDLPVVPARPVVCPAVPARPLVVPLDVPDRPT